MRKSQSEISSEWEKHKLSNKKSTGDQKRQIIRPKKTLRGSKVVKKPNNKKRGYIKRGLESLRMTGTETKKEEKLKGPKSLVKR